MPAGTQIDLGHAMITMVEPTRDREALAEYNRWYDHDHAYSGVMVGPWAFAFQRWVATRALKDLRFPSTSPIASPVDQGSFIAAYFMLANRAADHFAWSFEQTAWLNEQGRMNPDREHISTSLYDFTGSVNRDGWPVPAEVALDHPYQGLAALWIDRTDDAEHGDLDRWLRAEALPNLIEGSAVAQALVFAPCDFPGVAGSGIAVGDRVCVLAFLQGDPHDVFVPTFEGLPDLLTDSGLGTLALAAPFIPVLPGTETYLDELW